MVGKGKGPSFLRKFAPTSYYERKTNETTIKSNEETESSTFRSLGEIGNLNVPYNPSISFHSAPTAGSYNITLIYSHNFHEGYDEMPYENKCDPEEEERVDSNKFYVPYYETVPLTALHINENASRSEREQMLLNIIALLKREKAKVEARNAFMSKQTGPSYNTRGKRKQAMVENADEAPDSRKELHKLIAEGIKDSLPMIFTEME
ncbi:hypothetical protein L1987_18423 [Smallanthus sonchifolius]|uniref:Uncharacterized protein n=1 Tax=Smallanthus sonchifolius TaxID=185202 RepID=A0ACB9J1V2_9ASTR|nr:hypothetical protein L1987_18423 [Smallanthus sonchifolius]